MVFATKGGAIYISLVAKHSHMRDVHVTFNKRTICESVQLFTGTIQ